MAKDLYCHNCGVFISWILLCFIQPRKNKWEIKTPGFKPSKPEPRKRNQSIPSALDSDSILSPPSPNAPMSPTGIQKRSSTMLDTVSVPPIGSNRCVVLKVLAPNDMYCTD